MSKVYIYKHKGYELHQTEFNWHFVIINQANNKIVMHAQQNKRLSESEAIAEIESFINMQAHMKDFIEYIESKAVAR